MAAARTELEAVLGEDALREAVLLVMANKQDLPTAMRVPEITEKVGTAVRWCDWSLPLGWWAARLPVGARARCSRLVLSR